MARSNLESIADVPCFPCILQDEAKVSLHRCKVNCEKIEKWLEEITKKEG